MAIVPGVGVSTEPHKEESHQAWLGQAARFLSRALSLSLSISLTQSQNHSISLCVSLSHTLNLFVSRHTDAYRNVKERVKVVRALYKVTPVILHGVVSPRTGTVTSTMRRAAHPSGCVRCGAGAGCSGIKYQSLVRARPRQSQKEEYRVVGSARAAPSQRKSRQSGRKQIKGV